MYLSKFGGLFLCELQFEAFERRGYGIQLHSTQNEKVSHVKWGGEPQPAERVYRNTYPGNLLRFCFRPERDANVDFGKMRT